ncbi:IS110 family transposase [Marinobacterium rhizophilum]|uniref:IS110 family transposase n=1 Tax=Marinobacterium rhizophilum TaxID=420402 RepID=UPI00037C4EE9|nr:IS110 family transposase [Marinobacterium rhizophilum]
MKLYAGIDLHSINSVVSILDETDHIVFERRLDNDLERIKCELGPYREQLEGIVVESTFNWYWLVDGLQEAGHRVHLANPAGNKQYSGLKYTSDQHDARWLAHILRLGILKEGYIYPKQERAFRDLLRKRMQLVRLHTTQILSIQNLIYRNAALKVSSNDIKRLNQEQLENLLSVPQQSLAASTNLVVMQSLEEQINLLEAAIKEHVKPRAEMGYLKSVSGIGDVLGWVVLLETGDIHRFKSVGNYASYCRCVESRRESNGKKKGENNRKNGNKYLAWAFVEAANFAVRYHEPVKRFYQRKKAKRNGIIAIKAVAHKLARATFHILKNGEPFNLARVFP